MSQSYFTNFFERLGTPRIFRKTSPLDVRDRKSQPFNALNRSMQVSHPSRQSFATYKARKGYRKDLQQHGVKGFGKKESSRNLVNKEPLSSSLKHNDQQLFKLLRLSEAAACEDEAQPRGGDEAIEEAGVMQNKAHAAPLREMVADMAEVARDLSRSIDEERQRSLNWGEYASEKFEFVTDQSRLYLKSMDVTPYTQGEGKIRPRERIGEVE